MPTLIIIGFQYHDTEKLTSTITDMYIVYSFYRKLGFRIYLAMDNVQVNPSTDFTRLLVDGIVDEGYSSFVKHISDIRHVVFSRSDLDSFLGSIQLSLDRKVVFYYTGHGHMDGIILPDTTVVSNQHLLGSIMNLSVFLNTNGPLSMSRGLDTSDTNLLIIMDCCYFNGMLLPFRFREDDYEEYTQLYVPPKIICIAPSDTILFAHSSESPFTRQLFNLLKDNQESVNVASIVKKLSGNVYASYSSLYILWGWTFGNVNLYEQLNTLIVERK